MPDGKYLSCLEGKTEEVVYLFRMDDDMIQVLEEETGEDFAIDGEELLGSEDDDD